MRELISFVVGALAGGAVAAIYYRRAAAELARLKREVELRVRSL
jgi:hypothetical protein